MHFTDCSWISTNVYSDLRICRCIKIRAVNLKVHWWNLHNKKQMIASIQITNTEILALIAVLVFMLLCFKLLFANKKIQKELLKSSLLFKIIENFTGKYCKIIVASSFKNAEIFELVFFLVFKLLSCKIVFINRKDSRNYYKVCYFL